MAAVRNLLQSLVKRVAGYSRVNVSSSRFPEVSDSLVSPFSATFRIGLSLFVAFSSSGCVIWPHTTSQFEVRGRVFDNKTLRPIPQVEVEVNFPETREDQETKTSRDGSFSVRSDGQWNWILYLFDETLADVPLEMNLSHPGYDTERISDLRVREQEKGRFLDVGSLYLDKRR